MSSNRTLIITGLFVFIHFFSFAQQQPTAKTLLWKISGRGLTKPSYLFGTMHLTDKRLFRHDDSVFYSISATEGFAMEVNPEEMAASLMNEMFNDLEKKKKLESILDAEDFNRHKKAIAKKFKKDAEDVTVNDVVTEKNRWVNDFMAKGEMPTMLDAYLYNMARKQGKWIGGIEDLVDQEGLEEDLVDVTDVEYLLSEYNNNAIAKKQLEKMIRVYTDGDLAGIEAISSGSQSAYERDAMLIKRNVKMARRMDSLSAIRTMFFAVGAAHLPGDSGVIDLLKRRGFTVEPVFSKKKINAADYKFQEVEIPWKTVTDKDDLYTVSMPGTPIDFKHMGLVNMKFYMDLFNLTAYATMAATTPMDLSNPDSLFLAMAKNIFTDSKGLKQVVIDSAGIPGREYVGKVENGNARIRLFLHENVMYMAMAMQMKKEKSYPSETKKFFNSFLINKDAAKNRATTFKFIDSLSGIYLESTAELTYNEKMSNPGGDEWKASTYSGADMNSGAYIMLISKETVPGRYIVNDTLVMAQMFEYMEQTYGKLKKKEVTVQGLPALMFEGEDIGDEKLSLKMLTVVRGNRNILLMVFAQKAFFEKPESRKIFESLRLLPYPSRPWKYYTDSTNTFTAWTPAPFKWNPYTYTGYRRGVIVVHDSIASLSFNVTIDTLNRYYSVESDSLYWEILKSDMVGENDSLIKYTTTVNGKSIGREYVIRKNHSNMYQRGRVFLYGNYLVIVHATSHLKELYDDNVVKFFNDFRAHTTEIPFSIGTSKSNQLLEDLVSKDSATKKQAVSALSIVDFYKEDSTLLQSALLTDYGQVIEDDEETDVNYLIAQKVAALKNPGTIDFIKRNYLQLKEDSLDLRTKFLYILANLKTKESVNALAELVLVSKPKHEFNEGIYTVFLDSLDLALTYLNHAKALRSDSIHGPLQALFYLRLLDSSLINYKTFAEGENDFIKVANYDLNAPDSVKLYLNNSRHLIQVMGKFKSPAAAKVLNRYLRDERRFIRLRAAIELARMNQPIDAAIASKLAADPEIRQDFYDQLKEIKRESVFPAAYSNQKSLSEASLYLLEEDVDVLSKTYIGTKTAKVKGTLYRFQLWKVTFDSEELPGTYLAVIGGYSVEPKNLSIINELSGYHKGKTLGEVSASKLFDEFIEYRNQDVEE